jgi:hypothetical protein
MLGNLFVMARRSSMASMTVSRIARKIVTINTVISLKFERKNIGGVQRDGSRPRQRNSRSTLANLAATRRLTNRFARTFRRKPE